VERTFTDTGAIPHREPSGTLVGFRTTTAFCDADRALVVACSWNGMTADDAIHSKRQNELCSAIYEDLQLV
jgi:hypothetical protein